MRVAVAASRHGDYHLSMNAQELKDSLPTAALAFRGYNVTNLGRSGELLAHPAYGDTVREFLERASQACSDIIKRPCDLVSRVRDARETNLDSYADAVSLILAMEMAQLALLQQHFGIAYRAAPLSFGYSLGEIGALVAGGVYELHDALRIPLALADDCVALATDVTLGVLISRGPPLPLDEVTRACLRVNQEGRGVIGMSSHLSPNSLLLLGQADTLDRFKKRLSAAWPQPFYLRKKDGQWPPMHTPIVWQRQIADRAAQEMHALPGGFTAPIPPVLSLVTGDVSYSDYNSRDILHRWVDEPQLLWDAVYQTLTLGIETVVHVGPAPNILPATYTRLAENVASQTKTSIGMRAMSRMANRPWLRSLLPARSALLRAPTVKQIILEDWLLEQKFD